MFDISWTEFLLIGIVALVVIGPKELPAVMRTTGQWTRKLRGMAADFQNQFHEAMREAEIADLKNQVDDMAQGIKNYDPLKTVRSEFDGMGKDFEASLESPKPAAADAASEHTFEQALVAAEVETVSSAPPRHEALPHPASEFPAPEAGAEHPGAEHHGEAVIDTATAAAPPQVVHEPAAESLVSEPEADLHRPDIADGVDGPAATEPTGKDGQQNSAGHTR